MRCYCGKWGRNFVTKFFYVPVGAKRPATFVWSIERIVRGLGVIMRALLIIWSATWDWWTVLYNNPSLNIADWIIPLVLEVLLIANGLASCMHGGLGSVGKWTIVFPARIRRCWWKLAAWIPCTLFLLFLVTVEMAFFDLSFEASLFREHEATWLSRVKFGCESSRF